MKLTEILKPDNVLLEFKGNSKNEILNEIINSLSSDSRVLDIEVVRQVVLEREKIMSTGVGSGFAISAWKNKFCIRVGWGIWFVKESY